MKKYYTNASPTKSYIHKHNFLSIIQGTHRLLEYNNHGWFQVKNTGFMLVLKPLLWWQYGKCVGDKLKLQWRSGRYFSFSSEPMSSEGDLARAQAKERKLGNRLNKTWILKTMFLYLCRRKRGEKTLLLSNDWLKKKEKRTIK